MPNFSKRKLQNIQKAAKMREKKKSNLQAQKRENSDDDEDSTISDMEEESDLEVPNVSQRKLRLIQHTAKMRERKRILQAQKNKNSDDDEDSTISDIEERTDLETNSSPDLERKQAKRKKKAQVSNDSEYELSPKKSKRCSTRTKSRSSLSGPSGKSGVSEAGPSNVSIFSEAPVDDSADAARSLTITSEENEELQCSDVEAHMPLSELSTSNKKEIPSAMRRSDILAKIELIEDKDNLEPEQSENIFTSIKKFDSLFRRISRCFKCLDSPISTKFRRSDVNLSNRTIEFHCKECGILGTLQESNMISISETIDEVVEKDITTPLNEEITTDEEIDENLPPVSQHEEYEQGSPTKRSKPINKAKKRINKKSRSSNVSQTKKDCISLFGAQFTRGVLNGSGTYEHGAELLSSLNLHPISRSSYLNLLNIFVHKLEGRFKEVKGKVAQEIKQQYIKRGHVLEDGMMNISVSYNGSWATEGHGSLIGIGFVCEIETGIALDVEILSKYCATCDQYLGKNQNKLTEEEIEQWKNEHRSSCDINYSKKKSSGVMEDEMAIKLFSRSVENGLRYTTMVSDHFSSPYERLKEANIYGDKFLVKKKNSLNYSSEVMVRELKDKISGKSGLTDKVVEFFVNIYKKSIEGFLGNNEEIRNNVLGSIFHHSSSKDNVTHQLCPTGKTSACAYQKDVANGVNVSDWHQRSKRKLIINKNTSDLLITYFTTKLSDSALNSISGKTQLNKSLLSKVWSHISNNSFTTIKHVKYVCYKVAIDHNFGYGKYDILCDFNIPLSKIYRDRLNFKEGRRTRNVCEKTPKNKRSTKKKK